MTTPLITTRDALIRELERHIGAHASIVANDLIASDALARLLADAEQRGARGVRHMAERAIRKGYDLDPQEVLDALPQDPDTPTPATLCGEFIDTGSCGHSDAEHDALVDAIPTTEETGT